MHALGQKQAVHGGVLLDNMVKLEHFSFCFLQRRSFMVLLKAVSRSAQEAWSQAAEFHKQQGLIFKSLGFLWLGK